MTHNHSSSFQTLAAGIQRNEPVFEPIENFLPGIEATIAQKDINAFNTHANVIIDYHLEAIQHLPRQSFDNLFNFNVKTLMGSRLSDHLKSSTVDYLKKLKDEYMVKFEQEIVEKTTAVNNYKTVLRNIKHDKNYHEKFFEEAPIIANMMNDVLFEHSRMSKEILGNYINKIYMISVDTLKNEALNWSKTADGEVNWNMPANSHELLMPFGTTVLDQLLMGPSPATMPGGPPPQGQQVGLPHPPEVGMPLPPQQAQSQQGQQTPNQVGQQQLPQPAQPQMMQTQVPNIDIR